jgi:hypothetical protein
MDGYPRFEQQQPINPPEGGSPRFKQQQRDAPPGGAFQQFRNFADAALESARHGAGRKVINKLI